MSWSADDAPQLASWVPEEAVLALQTERAIHNNETPNQLARRLIEENLPMVTMSMINLAIYGEPTSRIAAGKYLLEANAIGKDFKASSGKQAWDEVFDAVLTEAEDIIAKK